MVGFSCVSGYIVRFPRLKPTPYVAATVMLSATFLVSQTLICLQSMSYHISHVSAIKVFAKNACLAATVCVHGLQAQRGQLQRSAALSGGGSQHSQQQQGAATSQPFSIVAAANGQPPLPSEAYRFGQSQVRHWCSFDAATL